MLEKTFVHVPGIGPTTELKLWNAGAEFWTDCIEERALSVIGPAKRAGLKVHLRKSSKALQSLSGGFFQECVPNREMWRLYPEFRSRAVFLDIETTGLSAYDEITVVSMFDGTEARALVKGQDLEEFPELISKYSLIVTYNGATFDLPFLHRRFRDFKRDYAHIDLRYPLARLGYKGGLKNAERMAGIIREGELQSVDGYMAVLLWYEYKRGNKAALSTLLRYALEDVVNLRDLMALVYNKSIDGLPIAVPHLELEETYRIDVPYDPGIVRRLRF